MANTINTYNYFENLLEGLRLKLYENLDNIIEDARYVVINPEFHQAVRNICEVAEDARPSIFGIELRLNNNLEYNEVKVVWYDREAQPIYYRIDDKRIYEKDILSKMWAEKEHKCSCGKCDCDKESDITVSKDADKKEITLTVNGSVVYNDFI